MLCWALAVFPSSTSSSYVPTTTSELVVKIWRVPITLSTVMLNLCPVFKFPLESTRETVSSIWRGGKERKQLPCEHTWGKLLKEGRKRWRCRSIVFDIPLMDLEPFWPCVTLRAAHPLDVQAQDISHSLHSKRVEKKSNERKDRTQSIRLSFLSSLVKEKRKAREYLGGAHHWPSLIVLNYLLCATDILRTSLYSYFQVLPSSGLGSHDFSLLFSFLWKEIQTTSRSHR